MWRCHSILNQVKACTAKKQNVSINKESIRNSVSYQTLSNKIQYANDEQQLFRIFEQNNHLYKIGHLSQSLRVASRLIKSNIDKSYNQNYRFNMITDKRLQELFSKTMDELSSANEMQLLDVLFFVRNFKHNIQDRIWLKHKMITNKEVEKLTKCINSLIEQDKYNLNNLSDICFGFCVLKMDISIVIESILNTIKQDVRQITPYMMFSILKVYSLRGDQELTKIDTELLEIIMKQYLLNLEYLELADVIEIYLNLLQISFRNMQKVTNKKTIKNGIDMTRDHLLQNIEQFQKQQIIKLMQGYRSKSNDGPDELLQQIQDMVAATLSHNHESMDLDFTVNYLYCIISFPQQYWNHEHNDKTLRCIKKVIQGEQQLKSLLNQMLFSIAAHFRDIELLDILYQKNRHEQLPINQIMILIRFNINVSELKFYDQQVVYKYMAVCQNNRCFDGKQQEEEQKLREQIIESVQTMDDQGRKNSISIFNQLKNIFEYMNNQQQYDLIKELFVDIVQTLFRKQYSHQVLYFLSRYIIHFVNYYSYDLIQRLMINNLETINREYCKMIMQKNKIVEEDKLKNNLADNMITSVLGNVQNQNQELNVKQVHLIIQISQIISPKYYFQFIKFIKKILKQHIGQNKESILNILKFMSLCLEREEDTQQVVKDIVDIILQMKMNKVLEKCLLFEHFEWTFSQCAPIMKQILLKAKECNSQVVFKNEVVFRLAIHYDIVSSQECLDVLQKNSQFHRLNHLVAKVYYDTQIYQQNQNFIDQLCQKNVDNALKQLVQTNSKQVFDNLNTLMHYETKFYKEQHDFVIFRLKNIISGKDAKQYLVIDLIQSMPDKLSETQMQYQQEIVNNVIQNKQLVNSKQILLELRFLNQLKVKYLTKESVQKLSLKIISSFKYIKHKTMKLQYAYFMIIKNILEQSQIEQILQQLLDKQKDVQDSNLFQLSHCFYLANNKYSAMTSMLTKSKMRKVEMNEQPFQLSPACYVVLVQPNNQEILLKKYLQGIEFQIQEDYGSLMQLHYLSLYLQLKYGKIYSDFKKRTEKYGRLIDEQLELQKDRIEFKNIEKYLKSADIEFEIKGYQGIEYILIDNQKVVIKPCLNKYFNRSSENLRGIYQLQLNVLKALHPECRLVTLNIQQFNQNDISQREKQQKIAQLIKLGISFKNDRIDIE